MIAYFLQCIFNKNIKFKILPFPNFVKLKLFKNSFLRKKPLAWLAHLSIVKNLLRNNFPKIREASFQKCARFSSHCFLPCFQIAQKQMQSIVHLSARLQRTLFISQNKPPVEF